MLATDTRSVHNCGSQSDVPCGGPLDEVVCKLSGASQVVSCHRWSKPFNLDMPGGVPGKL
eukprot:4418956-Amphidinium_carterae.6